MKTLRLDPKAELGAVGAVALLAAQGPQDPRVLPQSYRLRLGQVSVSLDDPRLVSGEQVRFAVSGLGVFGLFGLVVVLFALRFGLTVRRGRFPL